MIIVEIGWGMVGRKNYVEERFEVSRQKIADEFGISRGKVAEIEQSALRKFREILEAKGYQLEDFFGKD